MKTMTAWKSQANGDCLAGNLYRRIQPGIVAVSAFVLRRDPADVIERVLKLRETLDIFS